MIFYCIKWKPKIISWVKIVDGCKFLEDIFGSTRDDFYNAVRNQNLFKYIFDKVLLCCKYWHLLFKSMCLFLHHLFKKEATQHWLADIYM